MSISNRVSRLQKKALKARGAKSEAKDKLTEVLQRTAERLNGVPVLSESYRGYSNLEVAALAWASDGAASSALRERVAELANEEGPVGKLFSFLKEGLQ